MKRLLCAALFVSSSAFASPLSDVVGALDFLCGVNVPGAVLDQVGGESVQTSLCSLRDLAARGEGLLNSATVSTEAFLRQAFQDGFDLLSTYTDFDTELGAIQTFAGDLDALIRDGLSLESAYAFITRSAGVKKINELLAKSTAPEGSVAHTVEESRRLNPAVLSRELQSIETTTNVQKKAGEVVDIASNSLAAANASLARGDEADLVFNVADPDPLKEGTAERAGDLGEKATSTRSAVQILLDFETKSRVQQATEMSTLISSIKELGLIEAKTVQQVSYVARELYAQRLEEANTWRDSHRRAVEQAYSDAQQVGSAFQGLSVVLDETASELKAP